MDTRNGEPSTGPLADVRILAVEQMQAIPYATQLLAHLGADVVKVEDPVHGESGRASKPAVRDADGRDVGATYLRNNLGKRSITLDIRSPEGRDLFLRLAPHFDVVAENFKPGTTDKLGIGYADVCRVHPSVVYVSVSGFGSSSDSPYSAWPAYAATVEAMSGLYEASRMPDERPRVGSAGPLGDISSAVFAALGTLVALRHRDRTGEGQHLDVAMFDAVVAMQDMIPFMWSMGEHRPPVERRRSSGIIDSFAAADGFFVLQVVREHQFGRLCKVIGHEEWVDDPRLATRAGWAEHLDTLLRPAIERWASALTKLEACLALNAEGVAAAPSNTPEDVLADPHLRAHHMLLEVSRPDGKPPFAVVGNPVKVLGADDGTVPHWPMLGEHTDEVLRTELGLSPKDIAALRDRGVV
jgi:crotonobetainyl-CoA:carnitine CoA-transferase CaiB-like acyl-CoA transferase